MQNEVLHAILTRRSVRAYKPDPVPDEILADILAAGQAAPYIMPDSRFFSVLRDRGLIGRLSADAKAEGIKLGDEQRRLFSAPGFDGTYGAPVAVVLSGNERTLQYEAICAAAIQNMLIAAQALGLASCWVYFPIFAFHGEAAGFWRKTLRIPDAYVPCAAVLLGYGWEKPSDSGAAGRYQNELAYIEAE